MLCTALQSHLDRRCGAVMSVSDIDLTNTFKCTADCLNIFCIRNHPYAVADAILRRKVIYRFRLFCLGNDLPDRCICPVCQKNRSGLRITAIYMMDTVCLFISTCILMFFYDLVLIIIDGSTCGNTGLHTSVHRQFIDIITGRIFPDKISAVNLFPEQVMCLLIHTLSISINRIVKLRLCPVDIQE